MARSVLPVLLVTLACAGCGAVDGQLSAKIEAQSKQIADIQTSLGAIQASLKALQADITNRGGRFQVMNGTPQFARNIMLIDTQTGQTWVVCETKNASSTTNTNWCAMDCYGKAIRPE
jgi:hypothetical protein